MTDNFFKKKYSETERKDVADWFRRNMDRLPKTLAFDKGTESYNLPFTVKRMLMMMEHHSSPDTAVYNGYIANLMLIRQKLKEMPDWTE